MKYCIPLILQILIIVAALLIIYNLPSVIKTKTGATITINKEYLSGLIILVGGFWAGVYWYLCKNKMSGTAWILFLAPLILSILVSVMNYIMSIEPAKLIDDLSKPLSKLELKQLKADSMCPPGYGGDWCRKKYL